jgi:hypothetical protein
LGFDLRDTVVYDEMYPLLSNKYASSINQAKAMGGKAIFLQGAPFRYGMILAAVCLILCHRVRPHLGTYI